MKKFLFLIGLISLFLIEVSFADGDKEFQYVKDNLPYLLKSNNAGTLFYMAFHPCWEDPGPNNAIRIYVSSAVRTRVTLEIPGLGIVRSKQTIPNDIIEFILPPVEAQPYSKGSGALPIPPKPEQVWKGRAIILKADDPIIAYGVTRYQYTSDGYLAYPVTSLGKVYQVASYADPTNNTSQFLPSYTSIVGIYDNTRVTFRLGGCESCRVPKESGDTLKSGEVLRRTINNGDVWLIPGIGPFNDLSGSKIQATKPVAVMSGTFCAYIPTHIGYCDFIIEQELPENVWGTKYHVTPIISRKNYSIVKVFAKKPVTQIFFDGAPNATIMSPGGNLGTGFIETRAGINVPNQNPRPVVIHSNPDYPINVVQFNPGQDDDNVPSDPFQLQLTPIQQYQTEIVFNTPGIRGGFGFRTNFINIVYKATPDGGIPDDFMFAEVVDGKFNYIPLNAYSSNPGQRFVFEEPDKDGRTYYSKTIPLPYDGVYRLKANDPFAAYAYGFSDYDSYGFPTSVATADLETPDTLAPTVIFAKGCDGNVAGTVTDEPQIDPENRSNLGLIYMDGSQSFNYVFKVEPFIIGETPSTTWTLRIKDQTVNAKAYLVFQDRAGNRKDTIVEHYAISPVIEEYYADYGTFKQENPPLEKTMKFTLKNEGSRAIEANKYFVYLTLDSKELEDKPSDIRTYQNFDLVGVSGVNMATLQPGQSVQFEVKFTARAEGVFRDSIGIIVIDRSTKDTCVFQYFTLLEAFVGNQYIIADDYDFKQQVVGVRTNPVTLSITNPINETYKATTALKVTGFITRGDEVGDNKIFEVKGLESISESNPLFINPGQSYQFTVSFRPDAVRSYAAEIEFIADAKIPDNVTKLLGSGVQPGLVVNNEDWGERLVDPNSYIKKGGVYPFSPYPSVNKAITIKNDGSSEVTLKEPKIKSSTANADAFVVEVGGNYVSLNNQGTLFNLFNGKKIAPGSELTVPVFFHPKSNGQHELVIEFHSDAPKVETSTLRGIGVFPRSQTQNINYGQVIVGTGKKTQEVTFRNTIWDNDYDLTIEDFRTEVDGVTTFGEFGSNAIFRWDRNNIKDDNGNVVKLPITLKPGQSITISGEYDPKAAGSYTGRLITVSNAEIEAVSEWTGTAIEEGITMTPAQGVTCQKQPITLRPTITNTGSVEFEITEMRITNDNNVTNFSANDFVIQLPVGTKVQPGQTIEIPVLFTPGGIYLPNSVVQLKVKTNGQVKNEAQSNLTVTATFDQFTSKATITLNGANNGKIPPGTADAVRYKVTLNRSKAITTAFNTTFKVAVVYKLDFLGLAFSDIGRKNPKIEVAPALSQLGYTLVNIDRKVNKTTNEETVTMTFQGVSSIMQQSGDIDLVTLTFDVYLPYYKDSDGQVVLKSKTTEISHLIQTQDPCFVVSGDKGTVQLDETCVDNLRPIQISASKYNLGAVNPNPVGSNGADINFSVGGSNIPTEIRLYNSNSELVKVLFTGTLNSGEYSVRLPVENLSSGVYYYEMVAGPFKDTKKLIIEK